MSFSYQAPKVLQPAHELERNLADYGHGLTARPVYAEDTNPICFLTALAYFHDYQPIDSHPMSEELRSLHNKAGSLCRAAAGRLQDMFDCKLPVREQLKVASTIRAHAESNTPLDIASEYVSAHLREVGMQYLVK